jgi:uncharacterized glyoxalase superfamily protein PhnB
MVVRWKPEGHYTITPYLVVPGVLKLIDFLKEAFGAEETCPPMTGPDGRIGHAEVQIGDSRVMMGEPMGDFKPMPAMQYLYVEDCDAWFRRAVAAGATPVMEPMDMFYGDRSGGVQDPAGNMWWLATHKEDVAPEELARRAKAAGKG